MEFRSERSAEGCRVFLAGRLDASSADAFIEQVEAEIRIGADAVALDMTGVVFVSSVGLGALLRLASRVRSGGGQLSLVAASDAVTEMLRVTRLDRVLAVGSPAALPRATSPLPHASTGTRGHASESPALATVPCGDGRLFRGEARLLSPEPATPMVPLGRARGHAPGRGAEPTRLSADLVAIGHMALARDDADACGRYGEAIVVGGVAVVTAASTGRSDFVSVPVGDDPERTGHGAESPMSASPAVWVLEGIACRGVPKWGVWFEPTAADVPMHALIESVAALEDGPCAVIVAGECGGLVGAAARTSPDSWDAGAPRDPGANVKSMLRFSADPAHAGDTAVVVAFVGAHASAAGDATVPGGRPLDPALPASRTVHAHAVAMSFRPVGRASMDAAHTVGSLLAEQRLRGVMHLVQPARSSMRRGLAWRISLKPAESAP
jgi:anti-sigma B factor antagonist